MKSVQCLWKQADHCCKGAIRTREYPLSHQTGTSNRYCHVIEAHSCIASAHTCKRACVKVSLLRLTVRIRERESLPCPGAFGRARVKFIRRCSPASGRVKPVIMPCTHQATSLTLTHDPFISAPLEVFHSRCCNLHLIYECCLLPSKTARCHLLVEDVMRLDVCCSLWIENFVACKLLFLQRATDLSMLEDKVLISIQDTGWTDFTMSSTTGTLFLQCHKRSYACLCTGVARSMQCNNDPVIALLTHPKKSHSLAKKASCPRDASQCMMFFRPGATALLHLPLCHTQKPQCYSCRAIKPSKQHIQISNTLALGLTVVEDGMMGVPSEAITMLALPQALLIPDASDLNSPEERALGGPRLGLDAAREACECMPCSRSCSHAAVPRSSAR